MNEPKLATTSEEPMPTVALDSPSAKVLADLGSVHQDLVFVTNCCERLLPLLEQEEKDAVLIQALWTAAVVAYTRCFVGDKRLGIGEDSFVGLEGDVVELHRLVLSMRNKHIAHSVNPFEVVRVGVVLSPQSSPVRKVRG